MLEGFRVVRDKGVKFVFKKLLWGLQNFHILTQLNKPY